MTIASNFLRLSAVGAVLFVALFSTSYADTSGPIVATVNSYEIPLSEVFAVIESFPLDDQLNMRKRIDLAIQSVVNEELLLQHLLRSKADWEKQFRRALRSSVAAQLISRYVKDKVDVKDEEIRLYYAVNRDSLRGWHVRVRQVRLGLRQECESMMQKIDSEETFAGMARTHSLDQTSAANGGDLGYIMYPKGNLDSVRFELEFFEMQLDEMRIFESEKGCHLVRVVEIDDPDDPPFEQIREFLLPRLETQQERRLLEALIERVSQNARIQIADPESN